MTLSCTAVKPDITITPNPHNHDFGDVTVNTTKNWTGVRHHQLAAAPT